MNSYQLYNLLKRHYHTRNKFIDVVAVDRVPMIVTRFPSFYICNESKSGERGTHWVVLGYISDREPAEFFDSRNHGIENYASNVKNSLLRNGNGKIKFNRVEYQAEHTSSCGQFCCWFIDLRSMSVAFEKCLNMLSESDLESNEFRVCNYVTRHMTNS